MTNLGTIHGFSILAVLAIPDREGYMPNRRMVVVDRGEGHHSRFVSAGHVEGEDSWDQGFYTSDIRAAMINAKERWERKIGSVWS